MPLELQAKLLRVLETSEYIQIGDTTPRKSNFRPIAATNRDLKLKAKNTVSVPICILIEYFRN
jgi:transcriptional regulator with PAS, ATPase and Fis domain